MEEYVGEPYCYTVDPTNEEVLRATLKKIRSSKVWINCLLPLLFLWLLYSVTSFIKLNGFGWESVSASYFLEPGMISEI